MTTQQVESPVLVKLLLTPMEARHLAGPRCALCGHLVTLHEWVEAWGGPYRCTLAGCECGD